jgi:hypothetical protein
MATTGDTEESLVDRGDSLMYASKDAGRNRVTSDRGALTSHADAPLLGTQAPWQMPGVKDVDGFGRGD